MHGVHVSLLEKQAESLGFPLIKMEIPKERPWKNIVRSWMKL
jgi:hypothetical protein